MATKNGKKKKKNKKQKKRIQTFLHKVNVLHTEHVPKWLCFGDNFHILSQLPARMNIEGMLLPKTVTD